MKRVEERCVCVYIQDHNTTVKIFQVWVTCVGANTLIVLLPSTALSVSVSRTV
jgi:hypothetical protein